VNDTKKRTAKGVNCRMKKLSLLVIGLIAVMVAPAYSATVFGGDLPDIKLAPGTQGDAVFDLGDFFDGATSYKATGGSLAGSVATVFGSANPGLLTASFTGTAGSESVVIDSTVDVTSFMLGNGPKIDNNNRLAGVSAGNIFFNGIVPGSSVNSAVALSGIPAGGSGSPGGVSGAAALVATIGQVSVSVAPTGLRMRDSAVVASGAGTATASGLTATLNANGTYSLAAANNFDGAWIVTLGAKAGASADGVHMLAAKAVAIDTANAANFLVQPPGTFQQATVTYSAAGVVVNAAPQTGALVIVVNTATMAPIAVGEYATVTFDYNYASGNPNIAAVAFDGALGADTVAYTNPGGANLQAGATKNIALSVKTVSGNIFPAFQVFNNGPGNVSVTISNLKVVMARPLVDYALNVNAKTFAADFAGGIGAWVGLPGATAPAAGAANNFASGAAGSLKLDGAAGYANAALTTVTAGVGTVVGEAYVQRSGAASAGSAFALVITDGVINNMSTFVAGASVPTDAWQKVICAGTNSAATTNYLVAQCAGFNGFVDDISVRVITDKDSYFDATLLGL